MRSQRLSRGSLLARLTFPSKVSQYIYCKGVKYPAASCPVELTMQYCWPHLQKMGAVDGVLLLRHVPPMPPALRAGCGGFPIGPVVTGFDLTDGHLHSTSVVHTGNAIARAADWLISYLK